jgi:ribosomal protein S18 acetylase RimI-like enzyme
MSLSIEPLGVAGPAALLAELVAANDEYWDGRDLRGIHQWVWFHQFGEYGLIARDGGRTVAYLLGVVTAGGLGYVQAIAVRPAYRAHGLGRALWRTFARRAAAEGATEVQAITSPVNTNSIAFHTRLGMSAVEIPDYAGPGQHRVLFRAPVAVLAR